MRFRARVVSDSIRFVRVKHHNSNPSLLNFNPNLDNFSPNPQNFNPKKIVKLLMLYLQ